MKIYKLLLLGLLFSLVLGCSSEVPEPPAGSITIGDDSYEMATGTYEWESDSLFGKGHVVADAASPPQIVKEKGWIDLQTGKLANLSFAGDAEPKSVQVYLWENGERTLQVPVRGDQLILPSTLGKHVLEIVATFDDGEASYVIGVEIK